MKLFVWLLRYAFQILVPLDSPKQARAAAVLAAFAAFAAAMFCPKILFMQKNIVLNKENVKTFFLRIGILMLYMKCLYSSSFFLLIVTIFLNGCYMCSDSEETKDLTKISYKTTSIAFMDSLMTQYAAKQKWSSYSVEYRSPKDDEEKLGTDSLKNKFVFEANWAGLNSRYNANVNGIVLTATLRACAPEDSCFASSYDFYHSHEVSNLFLELYGCDEYSCKNTSRVVLRDGDYRYVKSFDKTQFKISSGGNFSYSEFGDDCEVHKKLHFNLSIEDENVKIDWNVKYGDIQCSVEHCSEVTSSSFRIWG